jgi:Zn ribbon nucleic-acid-binding protein
MTRMLICPHCENEVEVTLWNDGRLMWYQCPMCRYYDTLDDTEEDDDEGCGD